jgi:hypothetical protein
VDDARRAVNALRGLGWEVNDVIFEDDPATPVRFTVPGLAREMDHPLPFGKDTRSRVSGWTTRALSAKPVNKFSPAARLAGLFLAAHSTSKLLGQIPPDLPEACRATLPDLLRNGFLAELSEDDFRLDPVVRHLSSMRRPVVEEKPSEEPPESEGKAPYASNPASKFRVVRLLVNDWLMETSSMPWTLRPGQAAQTQGITLPRARSSASA